MKAICKVDGCLKEAHGKKYGFCRVHQYRFKRWGDPLGGRAFNGDGLSFLLKVTTGELWSLTDCIVWPYGESASKNRYGKVDFDGRTWPVHRLSLWLTYGPPPEDSMYACHEPIICHEKLCVNPGHLYWGTAAENTADRKTDRTMIRGVNVPTAKLDEEKVRAIRASSKMQRELAIEYEVSISTIGRIKNFKTWSWLE